MKRGKKICVFFMLMLLVGFMIGGVWGANTITFGTREYGDFGVIITNQGILCPNAEDDAGFDPSDQLTLEKICDLTETLWNILPNVDKPHTTYESRTTSEWSTPENNCIAKWDGGSWITRDSSWNDKIVIHDITCSCIPKTCADYSGQCAWFPSGCDGPAIDCTDNCNAGEICYNNLCCAPEPLATTCGTRVCGDKTNNCGQLVSCGTCTLPEECDSNGQCVCVPQTVGCVGMCKRTNDGCGNPVECTECSSGYTCELPVGEGDGSCIPLGIVFWESENVFVGESVNMIYTNMKGNNLNFKIYQCNGDPCVIQGGPIKTIAGVDRGSDLIATWDIGSEVNVFGAVESVKFKFKVNDEESTNVLTVKKRPVCAEDKKSWIYYYLNGDESNSFPTVGAGSDVSCYFSGTGETCCPNEKCINEGGSYKCQISYCSDIYDIGDCNGLAGDSEIPLRSIKFQEGDDFTCDGGTILREDISVGGVICDEKAINCRCRWDSSEEKCIAKYDGDWINCVGGSTPPEPPGTCTHNVEVVNRCDSEGEIIYTWAAVWDGSEETKPASCIEGVKKIPCDSVAKMNFFNWINFIITIICLIIIYGFYVRFSK